MAKEFSNSYSEIRDEFLTLFGTDGRFQPFGSDFAAKHNAAPQLVTRGEWTRFPTRIGGYPTSTRTVRYEPDPTRIRS